MSHDKRLTDSAVEIRAGTYAARWQLGHFLPAKEGKEINKKGI
jgi:hypothetical protein